MNIPTLNEYEQFINEGFIVKDNTILFDSSSDEFIDTSFGKNKKHDAYQMKLPFGILYSVYSKSKIETPEYTEVLKAIKGQSSIYTIDAESYNKFLRRTALYMSKYIIKEEIDTIILLESSSRLLVDLSLHLNKYLPKYYDMFTYNSGIFKNPDLSEIIIKGEKYGLTDKTVHSLQQTIDRQRKSEYFSIKKFAPQFRKVITNWLKLNDKLLSKIVDKNIAIIDDIVTTGASMYESSTLLEEAGAAKVIGLSIIKGSH